MVSNGLIAIGSATTLYGNITRMAARWAEAFKNLGLPVTLVNVGASDGLDILNQHIRANRIAAYITLQGVGVFPPAEEAALARVGVRRAMVCLDHPVSDYPMVGTAPPGTVVTYPTVANAAFSRTVLRPDLPIHCLAHGATPIGDPLPWGERDIDIYFSGSLEEKIFGTGPGNWPGLRDDLCCILDKSTEVFDLYSGELPEEALFSILRSKKITTVSGGDFFLMVKALDAYARFRVRLDFINALGKFPVTIAGGGWQGHAPAGHHLLGLQDASEVALMVARSRIVLNLLPAYYKSHERLFESMAAGAATLSTGSDWLENAGAPAGTSVGRILGLCRPELAAEIVSGMLRDPDTAQALGAAGRAEFLCRHTLTHRASHLAGLLGLPIPVQDDEMAGDCSSKT